MKWVRAKPMINQKIPEGVKRSRCRIAAGSSGPGRRWGHTCNSIKKGKFLVVFGGYGKDNCQTNDIFFFDTVKQKWRKPKVKGAAPSPRDSHTCTTVGNSLFVFGGTDGTNPLRDLHVFYTTTNTWVKPSISGEAPEAREGHSAAFIGTYLYVFGGCGKTESDEVYYDDLHILDTEKMLWKRVVTSGTRPCARDSHTCSSWNNKLIVVGGEDANDCYLSDIHILDTDTLSWRQINASGHSLTPRAGHSSVILGKELFIFGGFTEGRLYDDLHVLNIETGVCKKIKNAGPGPSARFSVSGDCLDPERGILIFIGGCNQDLEALDDIYYLCTEERSLAGISLGNGQTEERQEKESAKKELKRKRHKTNSLDSDPSNIYKEASHASFSLPVNGQIGAALGKAAASNSPQEFEAKIVEVFDFGCRIETTMDGKHLRGVLFSSNPNFRDAAFPHVHSRKEGEVTIKMASGTSEHVDLSKQIGNHNEPKAVCAVGSHEIQKEALRLASGKVC